MSNTAAPKTTTTAMTASDSPPRIFHTMLTFRCPSTLAEALSAEAARRGTKSVSRVVRELLEQALKASA